MSVIDNFFNNNNNNKNHNNTNKSFLNTFFDKIYVINLKRSVSRLVRVSEQLRSYNIVYEIFNAVDGSNDDIIKAYDNLLRNQDHEKLIIKRPGEYAYLLTWANLLRKVIKERYEKILVFEDDVM